MSFIAAAVIGGGAALAGAYMSSTAAKDAAGAQNQASQAAIGEQQREYDQTQANNAPFLATGTAANKRLAQLLGLDVPYTPSGPQSPEYNDIWNGLVAGGAGYSNPQQVTALTNATNAAYKAKYGTLPGGDPTQSPDFGSLTRNFSQADLNADPVYNNGLQFGMDQGTGAINARALASGSYDSGATLKALTRFGNDYGSTKAGDSFNRFQTNQGNLYNRLAGISGTGQTAVNTVASAGQNAATNIGNLQTGMGNANAASIVGGANAWGGALSGAAGGYQNSQILQKLLGNQNGYTGANSPYIGAGADQYQYLGASPP